MNKIMTVKFEKDIGISDEEKNKLRYTLVLHFMEQLKQKGMYKVEEKKHDGKWVISASLVMPTIEAEPDNGWISVKKDVPSYDEEVLVYTKNGCTVGFYDDDGDWNLDIDIGTVTHWMPLPELKGE